MKRRHWHRITCPTCSERVGVTPEGLIAMHGYSKDRPPCASSGQKVPTP